MSRGRESIRLWWYGGGGVAAEVGRAALLPAELLYRLVAGARNRAYDRGWLEASAAPVPVASVGNLTVGGTGKTPVTGWLVGRLLEAGVAPAVLHGGYAPDEPALHGRWHPGVPVVVDRDRVAGAAVAAGQGAELVLLDDGFQHRRLRRDLDIVVIATERWAGPVRLLPRGPWREPPASLRRADAVLVTRKIGSEGRAREVAEQIEAFAPGMPVGIVAIRPDGWRAVSGTRATPGPAPSSPAVAVAAVAEPELFLANVTETGVQVRDRIWFGDHHQYTAADAELIRRMAAGRPVVTTLKDAVKLESLQPRFELWVLEQRVVPEDGVDAIIERMLDLVRHGRCAPTAGRPSTGTQDATGSEDHSA